MSRERENLKNAFNKARREGNDLLEQNRITWDDYCFVLAGFEEQLTVFRR